MTQQIDCFEQKKIEPQMHSSSVTIFVSTVYPDVWFSSTETEQEALLYNGLGCTYMLRYMYVIFVTITKTIIMTMHCHWSQ